MTNEEVDEKIKFIKAIESVGVKYGTYKLIFKAKGKYGEPEAWLYPKNNPKQEKVKVKNGSIVHIVKRDGTPVMEYSSGILISRESIEDKDYLKEYLYDYINHKLK